MTRLARLAASGIGLGFAPVAPGTMASLATVLALAALPWPAAPILAVIATLAGVWAIPAARVEGDPGWVVIDEIAGQALALAASPHPTPLVLGLAFAAFRVLDIVKPGPIGWADRKTGAIGIMADDLIAGAFVAIAFAAGSALTP